MGKYAQWKGKMNAIRKLALIGLFFGSCCVSQAITNTVIYVSGTNIVLSWPSLGYETYLIQYRQTLNATDSWSQLANDYYANSTNMTTYTLYGLASPPAGGGSGGGAGGGSPPSPDMAMSRTATADIPMAVPTNGSGSAVPLAIYPPGFDLSGFTIFDPATGESVSGSGYTISASPMTSGATPMDGGGGFTPDDSTNDASGPETGFFRVFHIPDWLESFDGYQFDGPTFIPVDFAAPDAPTNLVEYTTVLINGQPTDYADFTYNTIGGTTYGGMGIYFDYLPNGTNTIQLLTTVRQSDVINDQTPYMTFSNAPQTIVINNWVTYTNWNTMIFSNSYTFNAQSTATNVDWEIDIYDVNDNLVTSQTGHSPDGNISWTWDLTDSGGNSRLDDSDPFFYPYLTVNASPDPSGWMPPVANQFPSVGDWLFTYLDKFYDDGTTNYVGADTYYNNAISQMGGGPALWGVGFLDIPLKYGRSYTQTNRDSSWDDLRSWLESWNNRNLYYFGHGAPNVIGGDENTVDSSNNITASMNFPNSNAKLTSAWVASNVTKNKYYGPMPFRFVFLDGCDTAAGNWAAAWGVPSQVEPLSYYQSSSNISGARPNAFVGWDVEIGGSKDWGTIQNFWLFRSYWMANWSVEDSTETLKNAFDDALTGSSWVDNAHYSHMKIGGYEDMKFLDYNHAGDWP